MKNNFNLFKDINHAPLRVYNRVVMCHNLRSDFGQAVCEDYISCFSDAEKKEMALLTNLVQKKGKDYVMKMVTRNLPLPEEDEVEELV